MKSIYEMYQMLNESFQSKYVRMFAQDASLFASSFHKFCERADLYYIAWDQINDSDITKIELGEDKTDILKLFNALRAGKESYYSTELKQRVSFSSKYIILIGYKNDQLEFTFGSLYDKFYGVERKNFSSIDKVSGMASYIRDCDTVYMISVGKNDTRVLQGERGRSRSGMIPSLDQNDRDIKAADKAVGELGKNAGGFLNYYSGGEFTRYCHNLAEEAVKKWRKIVAENKFKRSSDTKEIDDIVKKAVESYYSFMQETMKQAMTNSKISKYSLEDLTKLITGVARASKYSKSDYGWLEGGIINMYQAYCKSNIELAQGGYYAADALKNRDSYARIIKTTAAAIEGKIKKMKADWGMS